MWGRTMGGARLLLPLLLLLLPTGSVGLQCLSCGAQDGSCAQATNVTCPPDSDVCAEALAAVTWSHGRFALGGRGCGRGQPGAIARALELLGLVVFERRRHCGGGACNHQLPLGQQGALPLPANASARTPNGLRCFGCPEEGPCPPTTIVQCYNDLRGCFHGNVTLRLGNVTLWREVRGCVRDGSCAQEWRGDDAASLSGSCCTGDLCNRHLANKTLFDPDLPRLELLPHGHAPTATPRAADNATAVATGTRNDTGANTEVGAGVGVGAGDSKATGHPDVAVLDPSVASGGKRAAGGKMAAGGRDKMAAEGGDKMAAGGGDKTVPWRQGRKDGTKGPSGRGHPLEGPGWLLPFLLLPLLR